MSAVDFPLAQKPSRLPVIYGVDDEEVDRVLLGRTLEAAGIANPHRTFATGCDLLDALIDVLRGAPAPLMCFVDVKMAGMSGLDVLRWIRAQAGLHGIPVVMLSSSDAPPLLQQALQFGAQCYVAKFPPPDQMREIVAAAEDFVHSASAGSTFRLRCNLLAEAAPSMA